VGGLEGGETKGFGDARHDEDVGDGVNIAELLATDEAGEDNVLGNAEVGGESNQLVALLAIAGKDEEELWVFVESEAGGAHHVPEAFLDSKTTNGRNDSVAFFLHLLEIAKVVFSGIVGGLEKIFIEGVIGDIDFVERDIIFVMDEAFGRGGDGQDFVGEEKAFAFDFVD